jgi:hypothetical protein
MVSMTAPHRINISRKEKKVLKETILNFPK